MRVASAIFQALDDHDFKIVPSILIGFVGVGSESVVGCKLTAIREKSSIRVHVYPRRSSFGSGLKRARIISDIGYVYLSITADS